MEADKTPRERAVLQLLLSARTRQDPIDLGFSSYTTGYGEEPQCCVMGVCRLASQL